ncbi:MAG: ATP synthase F1 subunit delta [Cyclobacteriaceae bacterium]
MSAQRIAARYAKPILELAVEQKILDKVKSDMDNFAGICKESKEFTNMLKSPIIAHLKKAEILKKVFDGKMQGLTMHAFEIITRKNRENVLPEVADEFIRMYNDKMGYQVAKVTTTFSLDKTTKKAFEKLVTDVTGRKPLLEEQVNPEIIGGYKLVLGDRQIDESVSGALGELKLKFQKEK